MRWGCSGGCGESQKKIKSDTNNQYFFKWHRHAKRNDKGHVPRSMVDAPEKNGKPGGKTLVKEIRKVRTGLKMRDVFGQDNVEGKIQNHFGKPRIWE